MDVPVSRITFDFEDISAAIDVVLPILPASKPSKGSHDFFDHARQVRLIRNGEGEEFETVTTRSFAKFDKEIKPLPDAVIPTNRANFTKPIAAIDRNIEVLATMRTAES